MSDRKLVVIGAGGHAKVVVDAVLCEGKYSLIEIVDENGSPGRTLLGFPVLTDYDHSSPASFIAAVGDNRQRKLCFERWMSAGWRPATIIHPRAVVSQFASVGAGTVVFANAVINADAVVAENCIVNTAAVVEHDCRIGSHSHISIGTHLAGETIVGSGVLFGASACSIPGSAVGDWSVVGAGAVVIEEIRCDTTVVGVPARPLPVRERA